MGKGNWGHLENHTEPANHPSTPPTPTLSLTQTHEHTVGCSLEGERAKAGSQSRCINSPHTEQHVLFWCNYGAGKVWFSEECSFTPHFKVVMRDLVMQTVAWQWIRTTWLLVKGTGVKGQTQRHRLSRRFKLSCPHTDTDGATPGPDRSQMLWLLGFSLMSKAKKPPSKLKYLLYFLHHETHLKALIFFQNRAPYINSGCAYWCWSNSVRYMGLRQNVWLAVTVKTLTKLTCSGVILCILDVLFTRLGVGSWPQ